MKIVVCVKEVLDPDAVNAYAIGGQLRIDPSTKTLDTSGIPLVMNGYDEQAIEAAMRLRDAGVDCTITVVSVGCEHPQQLCTRAFALGANDAYLIKDEHLGELDASTAARILAAAIKHLGGADLVLCGRQASDDDQGVVGPALATILDVPFVTLAKLVEVAGAGALHVQRALTDGEEDIEVSLPALVTVSSELGEARFPKAVDLLAARRKKPVALSLADIGVGDLGAADSRTKRVDLFIPKVQGNCEFVQGDGVVALAEALAAKLRAEKLI